MLRWAPGLVVLLAVSGTTATSLLPSAPFFSELVATGPLGATDMSRLVAPGRALVDVPAWSGAGDDAVHGYAAPRMRIEEVVDEGPSPVEDRLLMGSRSSGQRTVRIHDFEDAVLDVSARGPGPMHILINATGEGETATGRSQCFLAPGPVRPLPFENLGPQTIEGAPHWIEADCSVTSLHVVEAQVLLYNATVRVEHGPAHERRTDEFRAGSQASGGGLSRGARQIFLVLHVGETPLEIALDGRARFHAPLLFVAGQLEIPPARGFVRWGEWEVRDPAQSLRPAGAFEVDAPYEDRLRVTGRAHERAQVTAPISDLSDRVLPGLILVALAAAALWLARWAGRLGWTFLFTRLRQSEALAHVARRAIVDALTARGALGLQDIVGFTRINRGTVRHHLRILVGHGIVARTEPPGRPLYVLKGPASETRQLVVRRRLSQPRMQALLDRLERRADWTQHELAHELGIDRARVSRLLTELERLGVVRVHSCEGQRRYEVRLAGPFGQPAGA